MTAHRTRRRTGRRTATVLLAAGLATAVAGGFMGTPAGAQPSTASPGEASAQKPLAPAAAPPTLPQAGVRAGLAPRHSLRAPVTDEAFYFVMADRFENGTRTNDTGGISGGPMQHGFDPTNKGFYNGGDLSGLLKRIDYIQGLGTTSIWLTPSFKNKAVQPEDSSAGYHGYWVTDFTQIDPHLGTNAELQALVDAAHARGMKVYFDIITNHTADVIGYQEGARPAYVTKDVKPYRTAAGTPFDDRDYAGTDQFPPLSPTVSFPYTPVLEAEEQNVKVPGWLNDVTLYHHRGNTTFVGEDSYYGDFAGLDDLFTEHPRVVGGMIDIYKTWIREMGIDGFRIDTMKHVNDEFWQKFGPEVLAYARSQGKREFFMFGEVYDTTKPFTSQYTTRNRMQAVLDFPFQDAARKFASQSQPASQLGTFFRNDDWYTDADSNVYQLPTFLGNHDMGRIGYFLKEDNDGAAEPELLARDRLAHELMYFSRGNPVIYYGDEQGFTGDDPGGDQAARQSMFASQVPDYLNDDLLGTNRSHAQANFERSHPLYRGINRLAQLTKNHPALRNGAHQHRYAASGAGVYAFSRLYQGQQREYVVALNNSEQAQTAAPRISLNRPQVTAEANSRMHVSANVSGTSFNEVTFYAKTGRDAWRQIGTDDTRPYQVFHDVSSPAAGTRVAYRAVVRDSAGHSRVSAPQRASVPAPRLTIEAPAQGTDVFGTIEVRATADPERATHVVRIQRSLNGGTWQTLRTDDSSPAYVAYDNLEAVAIGTQIRYRAILHESDGTRVVSGVQTVTRSAPKPLVQSVTLAGSLQDELGCPADWDPACAASHLTFEPAEPTGVWRRTFRLPAGTYEYKVAIDDAWTVSYGANGGGDNVTLTVPAGGADVTFTWDQVSHVVNHQVSP